MSNKSKSRANYPIVAALVAAEDILGAGRKWKSINDRQAGFLSKHFEPCRDEVGNMSMIKSVADTSVAKVNQFLADNGFSEMKLDDLGDGGLYAAAILDVLLKWLQPGKATKLVGVDGHDYDAFTLKARENQIQISMVGVSDSSGGLMAVLQVSIATESGDIVNLLVDPPDPGKSNSEFVSFRLVNIGDVLLSLLNGQRPKVIRKSGFDQVKLPMISLDQENDISWLQGMNTVDASGQYSVIAQALQKNRLKMNETGVRAQSAAAIGVYRTCVMPPPQELVVNAPFFLWLERPGVARPLFAAFLEYDSWKNPGSLES